MAEPKRTKKDRIRQALHLTPDFDDRLVGKHEIESLANTLKGKDVPKRIVPANYKRRDGVLVATNRRVLFLSKKGTSATVDSFELHDLRSVNTSTGNLELDFGSMFARPKFSSIPDQLIQSISDYLERRSSEIKNRAQSEFQRLAVKPLKSMTPFERRSFYKRLAEEIGDDGFRTSGELKHLPNVVMPDEVVHWVASGKLESTGKESKSGGYALIALTDRRILILDKRLFAGTQTIAIDLDKVNSITGDTGLMFGSFKIQDGGDERKVGMVPNATVQPFVQRVQMAVEKRKNPIRQPSPSQTIEQTPDTIGQLERLADLMDRGILTPDEFASQKAKILSG